MVANNNEKYSKMIDEECDYTFASNQYIGIRSKTISLSR